MSAGAHEKSKRARSVNLAKYSGDGAIHNSLSQLVNGAIAGDAGMATNIKGDRCTVLVSVPNDWGGSLTSHPGHAGVVLWNSTTLAYQSFGILMDGTFASEEINVHNDTIKKDPAFRLWYFTKTIDAAAYGRMRTRMATLGVKTVGYGKVLVARGWSTDGAYSCVTAVDTILVAGGLSWAVASMSSTPYAYAQTFTRVGWYISYAEGHKHM